MVDLEGGEDGIVPEERRLRGLKTSFNLHAKKGKIRYLIPETHSRFLKLVVRQVDFSWERSFDQLNSGLNSVGGGKG